MPLILFKGIFYALLFPFTCLQHLLYMRIFCTFDLYGKGLFCTATLFEAKMCRLNNLKNA